MWSILKLYNIKEKHEKVIIFDFWAQINAAIIFNQSVATKGMNKIIVRFRCSAMIFEEAC